MTQILEPGLARNGSCRNRLGFVKAVCCAIALLATIGASTISADDGSEAAGPMPPGKIEFVGKNLIATANGTFHSWRVVDHSIDPENLAATFAVVEVDLASVDTSSARRDDHLRTEDFFEVEAYPVARVRAHNLSATGTSQAGNALFMADFEIDLHGVEKTIVGEIEQVQEVPPSFEGRLVIDRMDFAIGDPASRWNPMSIKEEIPVSFRVDF